MSIVIFLSLLFVAVSAIYLWLKRHYAYWERRNVPHEEPVFLFGNMKGIGSELHWNDINKRIYQRFKGITPIVGFYTFLSRTVLILDLDLIKQILIKDFKSCADRGLYHNVRDDPLTGNLLFLDGEPWHELRHKLSPVFTTGKLKFMLPAMVDVGKRLIAASEHMMSGDSEGTFEVKDLCARYTTDLIGTCGFGIECNSLKNPNAEFRRMGRAVFTEQRHSTLVQSFMFTNPALARRMRLKNFTDDVSEFFMKAVRETVALREAQQVHRNDFMDMLIELKQKRDSLEGIKVTADDSFSNGLTLEQLAAQAMFFFLAGFDTSSSTMSFCMYELALNPEVQHQLRGEIQSVLAKHDGEINYEIIKEMIYLEQVLAETLRKYSVLPHLVRLTTTDYLVPNTDIVLERGTRIFMPIATIHHDPEIFPEPEKFNPERFTADAIKSRHPCAYLPFGDGPRNCIGMRFGQLQVKIGIIILLQHFRILTSPKTQIPLRFSKKDFLIATESGVYLKLENL